MTTVETPIEGVVIDPAENTRIAIIRISGVRIYWRDIILPALLDMMIRLGISIQSDQREKRQQFGKFIDPNMPRDDDSIYFSDGTLKYVSYHPRGFIYFEGATYEAELIHVSDPINRELIVCTDNRNLLV